MHKRILYLAVVLLLATSLAWAGGEKAHKKDPAAAAAKLQEKLGLTDAQTDQVRALFAQGHEQMMALKARGGDAESMKAERKRLHEERSTKLKAILTPEQWTRYQELKASYGKRKK